MLVVAVLAFGMVALECSAWTGAGLRVHSIIRVLPERQRPSAGSVAFLLSDSFLENDLVAVRTHRRLSGREERGDARIAGGEDTGIAAAPAARLCVVRPDSGVHALCYHEDDVETDLFVDPRVADQPWTDDLVDEDVVGRYGEGWYGQRPVPSLGGGPGYGAEADEIWSIDEEVLNELREDGVLLPVLDVGIAHGEKARGGAF